MAYKIKLNEIMSKYNIKSLKEFSAITQIDYDTVKNWSCGRNNPSSLNIAKICNAFNCKPVELL